jgi:gliding motility-associated-like protein
VNSSIYCENIIDTFIVDELNMRFNIPDTTVCARGELTLSAPKFTDSTTYWWNTGSTQDKITVTKPGTYYVTATSGKCIGKDTIQVSIDDKAVFSLGNDTTLCAGVVYNLKGPIYFDSYKWNTGHDTSSIDIAKEGLYSLYVRNGICDYADSINIKYEDGKIDLGNDLLLCHGENAMLSVTSLDGSLYTWSNGSGEPGITLTESGTYWVSVVNRCGIFSDTLKAEFENCECKPFVPTAFTPNNDSRNDKIGPILDCNAAKYKFLIVNRFGQAVFSSADPKEKWDGTFKGQPAEVGTYFYLLQLTGPRGKDFFFKGDITLIR